MNQFSFEFIVGLFLGLEAVFIAIVNPRFFDKLEDMHKSLKEKLNEYSLKKEPTLKNTIEETTEKIKDYQSKNLCYNHVAYGVIFIASMLIMMGCSACAFFEIKIICPDKWVLRILPLVMVLYMAWKIFYYNEQRKYCNTEKKHLAGIYEALGAEKNDMDEFSTSE